MCSVRILRRSFSTELIRRHQGFWRAERLISQQQHRGPLQLDSAGTPNQPSQKECGGDQQQERPRRTHQGGQTVSQSAQRSIPSQPRSTSNRLRSDRHNMARQQRHRIVERHRHAHVRQERTLSRNRGQQSVPNCGDRGRKISRDSARRRRTVHTNWAANSATSTTGLPSSSGRERQNFHQTGVTSVHKTETSNRGQRGLIDHASQDLWTTPNRFKITM